MTRQPTNQEFVDEFEYLAYMGYLSACIGWGDQHPVDQDVYTAQMRTHVPLVYSDFQRGVSSDWVPDPRDMTRYNRIIQMTRFGKLLTGEDHDDE
jgi:hypothetical protein